MSGGSVRCVITQQSKQHAIGLCEGRNILLNQIDMKSACEQAQTSYMWSRLSGPWGSWNISVPLHNDGSVSEHNTRQQPSLKTMYLPWKPNTHDLMVGYCAPWPVVSLDCPNIMQPVSGGSSPRPPPNSWAVNGRPSNRSWHRRVSLSWEGAAVGAMPACHIGDMSASIPVKVLPCVVLYNTARPETQTVNTTLQYVNIIPKNPCRCFSCKFTKIKNIAFNHSFSGTLNGPFRSSSAPKSAPPISSSATLMQPEVTNEP